MSHNADKLVLDVLSNNLTKYEEQYQRLVEGLPDILYSFSLSRGGIFYSPSVTGILGYTPEHLLNHPLLWNQSIHADDRMAVEISIRDFLLGKKFEIEYRIQHADGHWVWLRDRSISIHEHQGEFIIEGIATDITELRHAKERIETKNNRLYRSGEPPCQPL